MKKAELTHFLDEFIVELTDKYVADVVDELMRMNVTATQADEIKDYLVEYFTDKLIDELDYRYDNGCILEDSDIEL